MPGLESVITQVQPPAAESGDDGPAGIIASVRPNAEGNASAAATSANQTGSSSSATPPAAQPPPTHPPPTPNSQSSAQANVPSGSSSVRSNRSSWKSVIASIFACCYPDITHSEVDVEKDKREGHALANTAGGTVGISGKGVDKGGGTVAPQKDAKGMVVKASGPAGDFQKAKQQAQPEPKYLLKPLAAEDVGRKCLVLDLDETLVHSSFKAVPQADFIIPVEIDGQVHNVYVLKRPGVDVFLQRLGPQFEVVVFTASLSKYADPVLDKLDRHRVVKHRLFREACLHHKGNYVKDLSMLGRDLKDVIILDNSPASYIFHPTNAIPISSWFNDPNDTELLDLIPFLEDLKMVDNVMLVLDNSTDDG